MRRVYDNAETVLRLLLLKRKQKTKKTKIVLHLHTQREQITNCALKELLFRETNEKIYFIFAN